MDLILRNYCFYCCYYYSSLSVKTLLFIFAFPPRSQTYDSLWKCFEWPNDTEINQSHIKIYNYIYCWNKNTSLLGKKIWLLLSANWFPPLGLHTPRPWLPFSYPQSFCTNTHLPLWSRDTMVRQFGLGQGPFRPSACFPEWAIISALGQDVGLNLSPPSRWGQPRFAPGPWWPVPGFSPA